MLYNLSDYETVKRLLQKHGFSFSKALGQNFLIDASVCPRMAEVAVEDEADGVLEIGPGVGVLTVELAKRAKKVVSIELDHRLPPLLSKTLEDFDNVEIVEGDAMQLDLAALLAEKFKDCRKVSFCANLPYYITSPILMRLLEEKLPLSQIVVMLQKETAERFSAPIGSRMAGAVTAATNYYAESELLFFVQRDSFFPAPKVDSAVLRLMPREKPLITPKSEAYFFALLKAAFSQRRKTAVNGISSGLGLSKDTVRNALTACGLSETVRAEQLSMESLCALADTLYIETKGN